MYVNALAPAAQSRLARNVSERRAAAAGPRPLARGRAGHRHPGAGSLPASNSTRSAQRFTRNGNPLFIPETSANPVNVISCFGKCNAIGYSPFYIERKVGPDTDLAAAYRLITDMAPAIAAQQGRDTMGVVRMKQGDEARQLKLGGYTLDVTFFGRGRVPIAPEAKKPAAGAAAAMPAVAAEPAMQGTALIIAAAKDEFFLTAVGGGFRIALTPTTPGPKIAGIGDVQEGRFVGGRWTVVRQLGGDETGQGEILSVRPNQVLRVTVYRYE